MEELIHNSNILLYLRLTNVILITLAIASWGIFYIRYKMIMAFAPITWLLHVLIYGIYRFSNTYSGNVLAYEKNEFIMDIWTALVIMHGVILFFVSAIESIPPLPDKKGCKK
jgi:hypothetical protein